MDEREREIPFRQPSIVTLPSPAETPAFLFKLWKALEATEFSQYISWSNNGNSFIIHDQNQFSRIVLPNFFKHSHFTSFVRQLNMYGFRKLTNMAYTSTTSGQEPLEFHHPQFIKGHPSLLEYVKRKSPSSFRIGSRTIKTTDLEKLISDFEHIKFEHDKVLRETNDLRNENTSLRSEVLQLKNKYSRHEQVLTRMMNFIILNALYPERTPSLLPGIKRRRKMIELNNNSQTLAIPESVNGQISLNSNYDVHTTRNLLQPLDASNIPYQPYFSVDNGFHTQEAPRNSLTLYNANYQGGVPNEEYSLALNPRQVKGSLHQQKEPYIRDDVRKAILAKTSAVNDEVIHPSREQTSFPMFPDQNACYTNEYENPDFEQYIHLDDEDSVGFPEGFDSTMLSEFLLPNPTLESPSLPNLNNLPMNSDLFNAPLISESDQIRYRMEHNPDEHNEDAQTSLYSLPIQKRV